MNQYDMSMGIIKFFENEKIPFQAYAFFISIFSFILLYCLGTKIGLLDGVGDLACIISMSLLLGVQPLGIHHFLIRIQGIPRDIFQYDEDTFLRRIDASPHIIWLIRIIVLVLSLFAFIQFVNITYFDCQTILLNERTVWDVLFSIVNNVFGYAIIGLFGILLWLLSHILLIIYNLGDPEIRRKLALDIYAADAIGGLNPVQKITLDYLIFYFICNSLIVISYVPDNIITLESVTSAVFIFAGIYFFYATQKGLKGIIVSAIDEKVGQINEHYSGIQQKMLFLISGENNSISQNNLESMKKALDYLFIERERFLSQYKSVKDISLPAFLQFIVSLMLPVIPYIEKIMPQILKI